MRARIYAGAGGPLENRRGKKIVKKGFIEANHVQRCLENAKLQVYIDCDRFMSSKPGWQIGCFEAVRARICDGSRSRARGITERAKKRCWKSPVHTD